MDLILDQTRGRPRQGHIRGHQPADPFNPARQQPEVITTGFLHQSHRWTIHKLNEAKKGLYFGTKFWIDTQIRKIFDWIIAEVK